ncbi:MULTISPECIES: MMPL family transporter [Streptomyces]|uniref:MMPL family transporter n=1 Tax=Streptomyces TaxID=1883 RepID=UPI001CCDE1F1|nr:MULTISPECIES: MMPL family transporter [Streptomyces]MBZ6138972.1 MMPL family transporter [Streptomyces olivaceus]MBZ6166490.1 MMPL family transporter [Streptomyces olivaceus]MBZ6175416.1 MMPL family transporter [Streptomyces olivaceus]MBZ6182042.1 MMPL family transporter [Streptomyces olivaceus]MCM8550969.1 MMPL family transporter [Streptomyces sp. STCH 565 A]
MATFLYRLGRRAFRRRGLVVLLWLAILVGAGVASSAAPAPPEDSFSMPGTESQKAFDLLDEQFPAASAEGATARVVIRAPDGGKITDPAGKAQVEDLVADLKSGPQVASVDDPFTADAVSGDGTTAYASVTYKVNAMELTDEARDSLTAATDGAREGGFTVETGGDAVVAEQEIGGSAELIGIGVAAVVLLLTFGSLVAAGMPLLSAIIGVGIGISAIGALGSTLELSATTSTLAMMIGLAVAIDYALFIVSRYRAETAEGRTPEEAAGRAVGTAGSAVVFAGLTVVVALAGLAVVNIPILTKMGLAAAGTVGISVLIALTLTPALLGFAGRKALSRKNRKAPAGVRTAPAGPALGTRWARFVLRRPVTVLLTAVLGLGVIAVPAAGMELGLPDEGSSAPDTTQRKAYDMLSDSFGAGFNGTLMVTVDARDADDPKAAADAVGERITGLGGAAAVTPAGFNEEGDTAVLTVVPETGPSDAATESLVHDIRSLAGGIETDTGATMLVTGATAMTIDFSQTLDDALVPYLALVVGLAFLLLMLVFRSVLVPLKAALGFLLSVAAALGAVVAVFQWGWLADVFGVDQPGPIMSMMPIFMIGVVFGLAMDYEVFLVTRMREAYVHGQSAAESVTTGFTHGGRVVAAAAVIMISVFSGFVLENDAMIKMMGFGLAIAVLFDAFVVRMAIVPAVLALLGTRAWWLPKWLDRLLPNVDVEGEKLHRELGDTAPPERPAREPETAGV